MVVPVAASQMRSVWSPEAESTAVPSCDHAQPFTSFVWPERMAVVVPVAASQMRSVLSPEAESTAVLSGDHAQVHWCGVSRLSCRVRGLPSHFAVLPGTHHARWSAVGSSSGRPMAWMRSQFSKSPPSHTAPVKSQCRNSASFAVAFANFTPGIAMCCQQESVSFAPVRSSAGRLHWSGAFIAP